MSYTGDMFRSYGSIRVLLVEADEGSRKIRSDKVHNRFFVSVALVDDKDAVPLGKFSSDCYVFSAMNGPCSINEEFIFDGVSSAHSLSITLNAIGDRSPNSSQRTIIPVSRLEEDMEIFQWYQMFSSSSTGSGRTETETPSSGNAIKLQIVYMKVEIPLAANPTPSISRSAMDFSYDHDALRDEEYSIQTTMTDPPDTTVTENVASPVIVENLTPTNTVLTSEKVLVSILKSPSKKSGGASSSRKDDIRATFSEDLAVVFKEEKRTVFAEEECSTSKDNRVGRNPSTTEEENLLHEKEGEERLTVGLIDYALLIGPLEDGSLPENAHYGGNRSTRKINVQYSLNPGHDNAFTPVSGLSNTAGIEEHSSSASASVSPTSRNQGTAPMESDMCIWDRFPLEDHDESPLPAKIEYFACPDGSKILQSRTRPRPQFSTFILSGAGESDGQYGVCLTIYIRSYGPIDDDANSPCSRISSNHRAGYIVSQKASAGSYLDIGKLWWNSESTDTDSDDGGGGDEGEARDVEGSVSWSGVTLCFLSRWPHVQQLQRCLLFLYRNSILLSMQRWEGRCDTSIAEYKVALQAMRSNGEPSDGGAAGKSCLMLEPVRLSAECVELLAMLCLESPVPLWGAFTLDIVLPGLSSARITSPTNTDYINSSHSHHQSQSTIIKFAQCSMEDLPLCPYSLTDSLFRCLGAKGVLTVLCAALAESRILFLSSDVSLLPAVCESLRTLLYPLKWAHVYLPVVPAPLLDLVQAPVPFILGTLSKWIDLIPAECLCDVVVVDLDTGAIDAMQTRTPDVDSGVVEIDQVLPFPPKIERWLLCALGEILAPNDDVMDYISPAMSNKSDLKYVKAHEKDSMVQLIVFDVMANLLRYVPGCIFSLNTGDQEGPSHHVFNRPLFLSDCIEEDCRPFLTLLTDTNAFEQFTESLYSPSMGFYLRALGALPVAALPIRNSLSPARNRENGRHIDRDVLPLSCDEVEAIARDDHTFPDSVINGSDRLKVVKLPTVSLTAEDADDTITALSSPSTTPTLSRRNSSTSIGGMLVFPAPNQQIGRPFYAVRTGSCDSLISRSNSVPVMTAEGNSSIVPKCTALLQLFPSWIAALLMSQNEEEDDKQRGTTSNKRREGLSTPVIDFYTPLLMCEREHQSQDEGFGLDLDGVMYDGYQSGSIIAARTPLGSTALPVLTLVLPSSEGYPIGSMSVDMDSQDSSQSCCPDSQDSRYPFKSPRLKALRSGSQLERELSTDEAKSAVRGGDKRTMIPLPPKGFGPGTCRPQSLNLSKTKRMRPGSVCLNGWMGTADSANTLSPSYLSFLPLLGKTSGLSYLTDSGRSPTSVSNESEMSPRSTDTDNAPMATSLAFQREDGVIVRSRSYGRIRSSTFSMVSSRKGNFKPIRRRHSAESSSISAALPHSMNNANAKPKARMPPLRHHGRGDSFPGRRLPSERGAVNSSSALSMCSSESLDPIMEVDQELYQLEVDVGDKRQSTSISPCTCSPVVFDTVALELATNRIDEWTVGDLAATLRQPLKVLLKGLKGDAELGIDPFSPWHSNISSPPPGGSNSGAESARSPLNARSPGRRCPNRAAVGIGGAITDYLQFAFSGVSMSPRQVEHLERRCVGALELRDNRLRLVHLLRQTSKGTVAPANSPAIARHRQQTLTNPQSHPRDLESQLFPLHSSTFELLSKLYCLAVEACVTQRDYLSAYGLLGVGGLYFQIQSRQHRRHSVSDIGGVDETEFLSERICQHPIFQSPHLWMAVLRDKLSSSNRNLSNSPTPQLGNSEAVAENDEYTLCDVRTGDAEYDVDLLYYDAYALLFIINRLGVNFERAAAFNKMIASDFSLAKGQYMQLHQYTEKLYGRLAMGRSYSQDRGDSQGPGLDDLVQHSRSRSKSDSCRSLPDWIKSKDRNSFPPSAREEMVALKSEPVTEWGVDVEESPKGQPSMGPIKGDIEPVLADLTLLLPAVISVSSDSGSDYTSPPPSWTRSVLPSFSPARSVKTKTNAAPLLKALERLNDGTSNQCPPTILSYGYAPHRADDTPGKKQRRGTEQFTPDTTSPTRRRASAIATTLKNYFSRRPSVVGSIKESPSSAHSRSNSSCLPLSDETFMRHSVKDRSSSIGTRDNSPSRCRTPERCKSMPCVELNSQNYYSVPLEGALLDRPNCIDTAGKYLVAGLRDGSLNINNLKTGELAIRLTHSTERISFGAKMMQSKLPFVIYGGVTHLKCFPVRMQSSRKEGGEREFRLNTENNLVAFASVCTRGIVRVWRLEASAASSGVDDWDEDTVADDGLSVIDQAMFEAQSGESVTCLLAERIHSNSKVVIRRDGGPGGWIVITGNKKGLAVISYGEFSASRIGADSFSEGEESAKMSDRRSGSVNMGIGAGHSVSQTHGSFAYHQHHEMAVHLVTVTTLSGEGEVTCLTLTRRRDEGLDIAWDLLALGTSTGQIALVDVSTGQCQYYLRGHSGSVTAIVSPSLIPLESVHQFPHTGAFIASCGTDRRVLLWDMTSVKACQPLSHSFVLKEAEKELNRSESRSDWGKAESRPVEVQGLVLCAASTSSDINVRSAAGPLTTLCVSPRPVSLSPFARSLASDDTPDASPRHSTLSRYGKGAERHSFVLAAAAADGSILLWELSYFPFGDPSRLHGISDTTRQDESDFDNDDESYGSIEEGSDTTPHPPSIPTPVLTHIQVSPVYVLRGHTDRVTAVKYRSCHSIETSSLDGTLRVWTRSSSTCIASSASAILSGGTASGMTLPPPLVQSHPLRLSAPSAVVQRLHTQNPFTCSAVLKLFGGCTEDNGGIAYFSMTCCGGRSRVRDFITKSRRETSPPIDLFGEHTFDFSEGGVGASIVTSALEVNEDVPGSEEGTSELITMQISGLSSAPRDKSWVIAVSLGGSIKAFITPTFTSTSIYQ